MTTASKTTGAKFLFALSALALLSGCGGSSSSERSSNLSDPVDLPDEQENFPDSSAFLDITLTPGDVEGEPLITARYDYRGLMVAKTTVEDDEKERIEYRYDDEGRIVREAVLIGQEAEENKITSFTYNPDGKLLERVVDDRLSGKITRYGYRFDATGNRILYTRDDNDDGIADYRVDYRFNSNNLLSQASTDTDADGFPDRVQNYIYNDDFLKIREEIDNDGDGLVESVEHYRFDDEQRQTYNSYDVDNDGDMERETFINYDEDSIESLTDYNGDSIIDRRAVTENLPLSKIIRIDTNNDGTFDQVDYRNYTETGKRTYLGRDTDADGIIDRSNRCEFYGPDEAVSKISLDYNGDGIADRTEIREFSDDGRLTRITKEGDMFYEIEYAGEIGIFRYIESPVIQEILTDNDCRG